MSLMAQFPFWWREHRYDSSFAQSNRTFAKMIEKELGVHNAIKLKGRPNTLPVSFNEYKMLCIKYIRLLLANSYKALQGEMGMIRVLAISPRNTMLIEQMQDYEEDEFGKPLKGGDDAIDALIAGVQPEAKQHRVIIEQMQAQAKGDKLAKLQPVREMPEHLKLRRDQIA